jgi:PPOX class probable F420-dependent enzyme
MPRMSQSEIEYFLAGDRHAVLATNSAGSPPQLTPVWFLYEDDRLYVSAQADTVKVYNLRRDPHVSFCIDGGRDDARYVVVSGKAELVEPGEAQQEEMRRRIIAKYHESDEAAEQYYQSIRENPAVLIVVNPERLFGHDLR